MWSRLLILVIGQAEIREAVNNGVIKMNIDTDTQWAYWDGIRMFYKKNEEYLQGQVRTSDVACFLNTYQCTRCEEKFS